MASNAMNIWTVPNSNQAFELSHLAGRTVLEIAAGPLTLIVRSSKKWLCDVEFEVHTVRVRPWRAGNQVKSPWTWDDQESILSIKTSNIDVYSNFFGTRDLPSGSAICLYKSASLKGCDTDFRLPNLCKPLVSVLGVGKPPCLLHTSRLLSVACGLSTFRFLIA
ncbi:hypothetical protein RvY_12531-2 [Ramazzottius varieornatus]|uniref:Uncharacterized protein n=1 Tax=Ramazzottius varieornatus TaxID=947166 RepID=A0A1D1VP05_RAMVA|nr:hypothetical protein RvY_12531-2 [Ramazzottius varieornatus]